MIAAMAEKTQQYTSQIQNVSVVYNIYRIILPLILLVTYISSPEPGQLGSLYPLLFVQVNTVYAIFGVVITFLAPTGKGLLMDQRIRTGALLFDVLSIVLLLYSCGGIASGLGLLLLVTVAAGAIQIRGRLSTFVTAVAVIGIIYVEAYLALSVEGRPNQFIQTGILGSVLFGLSLYVQTLTERIYRTAELADKQASELVDLEKLNNEILQRMRTGVVVVNPALNIVSMNSAARTILGPLLETQTPATQRQQPLPELAREQLALWKINPRRQPQPVIIPQSGKQVQINFAFLNPDSDSDVLVFLEDNRQIVRRVRQMKLASLGRLTASIAHEVRNPLGAISHASQLLRESVTVNDDDKRMLEIILDHCNRVNMIIEDVLDASRHDDTSASKIYLKDWLERFVSNYRETHEICDDVSLRVDPDDTAVSAISGQLEQVLNNLFDNGLRYSKKKTGRATLRVEAGIETSEGDSQPYVHIIDDGPGIDEETEAQLFEPFYTTESAGTGLGLYISKELCEANQSQLIYGRTIEGKSRFSIYFSHPDRSVA